jgi:hypothetical protein
MTIAKVLICSILGGLVGAITDKKTTKETSPAPTNEKPDEQFTEKDVQDLVQEYEIELAGKDEKFENANQVILKQAEQIKKLKEEYQALDENYKSEYETREDAAIEQRKIDAEIVAQRDLKLVENDETEKEEVKEDETANNDNTDDDNADRASE